MEKVSNLKPSAIKNYNSSTTDDRMGFAKRDRLVTDTIAQPMVINSLGRDVAATLGRYNIHVPESSALAEVYGAWSTDYAGSLTTPGIWVYDFDRVFALRDQYMDAQTADIFDNKWEDIRLFNNSIAKNIQPGDIQALSSIAMEIKCHAANIRRILNIMFKVVQHQLNAYYSGENLVSALGFHMHEQEMRMNVARWWQVYTLNIVDKLNAIRWFSDDFIPGCNRWAGLCREVYKDTPVYTDYCQVYMFRPHQIYRLSSQWDAEHNVYQWTFTKRGYDDTSYGNDHMHDGVFAFEQYLGMVSDLIKSTFYDDSAMDIIALLNTIAERAPSSQVHTDYFSLPTLEFGGEDVQLTYDFQMQMAVHNMTLLDGVTLDPPTIDPATGHMQQFGSYSGESIHRTSTTVFASIPKIIDLPWFGATTDDIINATQWTVTTRYNFDTVASYVPIHPGDLGTDVIVKSQIFTNRYVQETNTYELHSQYIGTESFCFRTGWATPTDTIYSRTASFAWLRWSLISGFEDHPLIYLSDCPVTEDGAALDSALQPSGHIGKVLGNTEIMYIGDSNTLKQIHDQFTRNFWGFPIYPTDSGQFAPQSDPKQ